MAISKKQFPYLLLLVASACFLLISDFLSSNTDVVPHRQMQSNVEYGEILPDGTLFIPVGATKGRSRGQNLQERVVHYLIADIINLWSQMVMMRLSMCDFTTRLNQLAAQVKEDYFHI